MRMATASAVSKVKLLSLPVCSICWQDFETDFSILYCRNKLWQRLLHRVLAPFVSSLSKQHKLPVSCGHCTAVLCHACVQQLHHNSNCCGSTAVKCPVCLTAKAFDVQQPNFNRAFATLLHDVRRMQEEMEQEQHSLPIPVKEKTTVQLTELKSISTNVASKYHLDLLKHHKTMQHQMVRLHTKLQTLFGGVEQKVITLLQQRSANSFDESMAMATLLSEVSSTLDDLQRLDNSSVCSDRMDTRTVHDKEGNRTKSDVLSETRRGLGTLYDSFLLVAVLLLVSYLLPWLPRTNTILWWLFGKMIQVRCMFELWWAFSIVNRLLDLTRRAYGDSN